MHAFAMTDVSLEKSDFWCKRTRVTSPFFCNFVHVLKEDRVSLKKVDARLSSPTGIFSRCAVRLNPRISPSVKLCVQIFSFKAGVDEQGPHSKVSSLNETRFFLAVFLRSSKWTQPENWTVMSRLTVKIKYLPISCYQPSRKNALASVVLRSWLTFTFIEPFNFFDCVTQRLLQQTSPGQNRCVVSGMNTGWIILIGSLRWILDFCDVHRHMQFVTSDSVMCPWAYVIIERRTCF